MKKKCRETGKVEETERRTMDDFSGVEGDGKRRRIGRAPEEGVKGGNQGSGRKEEEKELNQVQSWRRDSRA